MVFEKVFLKKRSMCFFESTISIILLKNVGSWSLVLDSSQNGCKRAGSTQMPAQLSSDTQLFLFKVLGPRICRYAQQQRNSRSRAVASIKSRDYAASTDTRRCGDACSLTSRRCSALGFIQWKYLFKKKVYTIFSDLKNQTSVPQPVGLFESQINLILNSSKMIDST